MFISSVFSINLGCPEVVRVETNAHLHIFPNVTKRQHADSMSCSVQISANSENVFAVGAKMSVVIENAPLAFRDTETESEGRDWHPRSAPTPLNLPKRARLLSLKCLEFFLCALCAPPDHVLF